MSFLGLVSPSFIDPCYRLDGVVRTRDVWGELTVSKETWRNFVLETLS